ncbi:MAG: hypothetical protein EON58_03435 [Alphaproteobacteria bacterium]|nr:MAG: hypothetical protein EON58_03435 [Alphaproteobacteria bacterium]
MRQKTHYHILLASPGDVAEGRETIRKAIDELNNTTAQMEECVFEIIGWETHVHPEFGIDPQAVVNEQMVDMNNFDIVIGMMWNRFGSPTARAESGTQEELHQAIEFKKQTGKPTVMLYFSQEPSTLDAKGLQQRSKVLDFKESVKSQGIIWDYQDNAELRKLVMAHVSQWLKRTRLQIPTPPAKGKEAPSSQARVTDECSSWVLIENDFYISIKVEDSSSNTKTVHIKPRTTAEDEQLRQLRNQQGVSQQVIRFAHQNEAGMANLRSAKSSSVGEDTVWQIEIEQPTTDILSTYTDVSYGDYKPIDLAKIRAKKLLFGQDPVYSHDPFLNAFLSTSTGNLNVNSDTLRELWVKCDKNHRIFIPIARLTAVFYLKASRTVDKLIDFDLGPIENGLLKVKLIGIRSNSGLAESEIKLDGWYQLNV